MLADTFYLGNGDTLDAFTSVPSSTADTRLYRRRVRLPNNAQSVVKLRSSVTASGTPKAQGHYNVSRVIEVQAADGTLKPVTVNLAIHWPEVPLASGVNVGVIVHGTVSQVVSFLTTTPSVATSSEGPDADALVKPERIDSILLGEI